MKFFKIKIGLLLVFFSIFYNISYGKDNSLNSNDLKKKIKTITRKSRKEIVKIGKAAVPYIIEELLQTEDFKATRLLSLTLGEIGDPAALDALIQVSAKRPQDVSLRAFALLKSKRGIPPLLNILTNKSLSFSRRINAAKYLGMLGNAQGTEMAIQAVKNPEKFKMKYQRPEAVQTAGHEALAYINNDESNQFLLGNIDLFDNITPGLSALRYMNEAKNKTCLSIVKKTFQKSSAKRLDLIVCLSSIYILGEFGEKNELKLLNRIKKEISESAFPLDTKHNIFLKIKDAKDKIKKRLNKN